MKILVTGGSGLLGSTLVLEMKKRGHDVIATFRSPADGRAYMDLSDINSIERCIINSKPDCIVHTAAITNVDYCELHPEEAMRINGYATGAIAKYASRVGAHLVYISTDYVFSGAKGLYREDDGTDPVNVYGKSKLLGEEEVRRNIHDFAIARASVIFGPRPASGKENFALWTINQLRQSRNVKVVFDQFVSPTLSSNLAEMLCEICERNLTGIFHLSGATRIDRYSFAVRIAETFGLDKNLIQPVSSSEMSWVAKRPRDSSLDVSKASDVLKLKPLSLGEALKRLYSELRTDSNA